MINALLGDASQVKVLVTSRARLQLSAETVLSLTGMDTPESDKIADTTAWQDVANFSAIQLFLQSARRVQPDFALTDDNWPAISQICRLVGGMPLPDED